MKNKIIRYIELGILLIAFICCFIPCVRYDNNLIIDIYVFDANRIMGYAYMVLLVISFILLITKFKKNKYMALIAMLVTGTLYIVSSLLRRNMVIHLTYGFYIVVGCIVSMVIINIVKAVVLKNKK
jgi:hypothetical protein